MEVGGHYEKRMVVSWSRTRAPTPTLSLLRSMYLGKSSWTFVAVIRYWRGLRHRLHAVLWSRTCRTAKARDCSTVHTFHPSRSFPMDSFSPGSFCDLFLLPLLRSFASEEKRSLCVSREPAKIPGGRRGLTFPPPYLAGALMGK